MRASVIKLTVDDVAQSPLTRLKVYSQGSLPATNQIGDVLREDAEMPQVSSSTLRMSMKYNDEMSPSTVDAPQPLHTI